MDKDSIGHAPDFGVEYTGVNGMERTSEYQDPDRHVQGKEITGAGRTVAYSIKGTRSSGNEGTEQVFILTCMNEIQRKGKYTIFRTKNNV